MALNIGGVHEGCSPRKKMKRVGRGPGSGHGKTCGRGGKGQTARSGPGLRLAFEGGQMPLFRRIPKRGFGNGRFRKVFAPVNLQDLADFPAGAAVSPEDLRGRGLAPSGSPPPPIKVLGTGDLDRALTVRAHAFSGSAKAKIEAAGGKAEIVGR